LERRSCLNISVESKLVKTFYVHMYVCTHDEIHYFSENGPTIQEFRATRSGFTKESKFMHTPKKFTDTPYIRMAEHLSKMYVPPCK
jgi:hypothetical protein